MTRIEGQQLVIKANVFSSSEELNVNDNVLEDFIQLKEFSDVEVVGFVLNSDDFIYMFLYYIICWKLCFKLKCFSAMLIVLFKLMKMYLFFLFCAYFPNV